MNSLVWLIAAVALFAASKVVSDTTMRGWLLLAAAVCILLMLVSA